jgi:hypothetical protein
MNIKTNMLLKILFENNIYELHDNCLENKISSINILKIPKGCSKAINRKRTDNTMAKRRRTDNGMAKRRRTDTTMAKRKKDKRI